MAGCGTELEAQFSGEEAYGKYFDLTASYNGYLALKAVAPISYAAYLDEFDRFVRIPPDTKALPAYKLCVRPPPPAPCLGAHAGVRRP
jgi:hypothetical protein